MLRMRYYVDREAGRGKSGAKKPIWRRDWRTEKAASNEESEQRSRSRMRQRRTGTGVRDSISIANARHRRYRLIRMESQWRSTEQREAR